MTLGVAGAMIANRYRLEALLRRGGYGEVWRAFDTHRSHLVALKLILHRNRTATWHEASLLTALKDEHILEVNNADVAVDLPYLDTALAHCSLDAKSMPLGVEPGLAVDWMRRSLRGSLSAIVARYSIATSSHTTSSCQHPAMPSLGTSA
jgi:eukaryotic-like serine/threonine-protein kinase